MPRDRGPCPSPSPPTTSGCPTSSASSRSAAASGCWSSTPRPLATIEDEYGTAGLRGGPAAGLQDPRGVAGQGLPPGRHALPRPARGACASCSCSTASGGGTSPLSVADLRTARGPGSCRSLVPNLVPGRLPLHQDRRPASTWATASPSTTRCCTPSGSSSARSRRRSPRPPTSAGPRSSLVLERLQDILLRERVVTAYQPSCGCRRARSWASRRSPAGPRGSGLESADALFGAAEKQRPPGRARPPLPQAGAALLGAHPVERQDLRQHAARHDARPAVPRARR